MKYARQQAIISLIQDQIISNQDMLRSLLQEHGFPVTQATVSRDIHELNLIKKADAEGNYRYVRPAPPLTDPDLFAKNIVAIDMAGHTVVIKCHSGMAQAVCTQLDSIDRAEIVGTLAGDDTIFVLVRTAEQAKRFAAELEQQIQDR